MSKEVEFLELPKEMLISDPTILADSWSMDRPIPTLSPIPAVTFISTTETPPVEEFWASYEQNPSWYLYPKTFTSSTNHELP